MTTSIIWLAFSMVLILAILLIAQQVEHNRQMMRMARLLSAQLSIPPRVMEPERPVHLDPYHESKPQPRPIHKVSVPIPGAPIRTWPQPSVKKETDA